MDEENLIYEIGSTYRINVEVELNEYAKIRLNKENKVEFYTGEIIAQDNTHLQILTIKGEDVRIRMKDIILAKKVDGDRMNNGRETD